MLWTDTLKVPKYDLIIHKPMRTPVKSKEGVHIVKSMITYHNLIVMWKTQQKPVCLSENYPRNRVLAEYPKTQVAKIIQVHITGRKSSSVVIVFMVKVAFHACFEQQFWNILLELQMLSQVVHDISCYRLRQQQHLPDLW